MGCLYKLTSPSGKCYIGITTKSAVSRFNNHYAESISGGNRLICRAFRKYGKAKIALTVLAISDSWSYLCEIEKRAISAFESFGPTGYNATAGGEGTQGVVFSKERKEKASRSSKQAMSRPETKLRHRLSKQLECNTVEGRTRLIEIANRPEVSRKKSESLRRYYEANPYAKKERNEKIKATSASEESKRKRSESAKAASSHELCAKRSELASMRKWLFKGSELTNASPDRIEKLLEDGWAFGKPNKLL